MPIKEDEPKPNIDYELSKLWLKIIYKRGLTGKEWDDKLNVFNYRYGTSKTKKCLSWVKYHKTTNLMRNGISWYSFLRGLVVLDVIEMTFGVKFIHKDVNCVVRLLVTGNFLHEVDASKSLKHEVRTMHSIIDSKVLGILDTSDTIVRLWRIIVFKLGVTVAIWDGNLIEYILKLKKVDKNINVQSMRYSIDKILSSNKMTWKGFRRGLEVLKIKDISVDVSLVDSLGHKWGVGMSVDNVIKDVVI